MPSDAQWRAQKKQQPTYGSTNGTMTVSESTIPYSAMSEPEETAPQVISLQEVAAKQNKKLYLRLAGANSSAQTQQKLKLILRQHAGPMPVYFYFSEEKRMVLAEYQFWVNTDIDLIMALSKLLGAENISVKEQKQEATE